MIKEKERNDVIINYTIYPEKSGVFKFILFEKVNRSIFLNLSDRIVKYTPSLNIGKMVGGFL